MNALCPHKWWCTLKTAVFGSSSDSSLPPLGKAQKFCESVGKAEIPSRNCINLPSTCHPSRFLWCYSNTIGIKRSILYVSSFVEEETDFLAPRLAVVFWRHLRQGSFPFCWKLTNVTPIPKDPPSSSVANYRQISITPILSKVFKHLVSVCLGLFMEFRGVLPTTLFAMGTVLALVAPFCVAHTLQSALEMGQEVRMV